jgi:hypothetical protein
MIAPRALRVLFLVILACTSVLGGLQRAAAGAMRWNLQNVAFTDGGSASGFFALDPSIAGGVADFDIKVSGGRYPALEYTPQNAQIYYSDPQSSGPQSSPPISLAWPLHPSSPQPDARSLRLGFRAPTGSGTYPVTTFNGGGGFQLNWSYEELGDTDGPARWVRAGGSITTGEPQPRKQTSLVKWTLSDVMFEKGHTATGWFLYDTDSNSVIDFDLHSDLTGIIDQIFPCQPASAPFPSSPRCWTVFVDPGFAPETVAVSFGNGGPTPDASASFAFILAGSLSDKGKTKPLLNESDYDCCGMQNIRYQLIGGSLFGSAVPEPSAASYLTFALAVLEAIFVRRAMPYRWPCAVRPQVPRAAAICTNLSI